jgi:hypothetical protein
MHYLRVGLFIGVAFLFMGCFNIAGTCGNTIEQEIISPDKHYKLVKFDRDCGATTSNSVQISVIGVNEKLENIAGNIFIADSDSVEMKWLSKTDILIRHRDSLQVFTKRDRIEGFTIHYESLIILPVVIDTTQVVEVKGSIIKIDILHGEWNEPDFLFKNGSRKLSISKPDDIRQVISAISSSKITANKELHTNWLHIGMSGEKDELSLVLVKTTLGKYFFFHKKDWYEGDELIDIIKKYAEKAK